MTIKQAAGRDALGEFAPEFAHFNDPVLFGKNGNPIPKIHYRNIGCSQCWSPKLQ